MSFLAPLFLVGLGALSVPVLIHLIHRERREVVEFPSLMFLQRIPYRSVRRQKLRHLLLLALRCLALAIVVTAFARPFFRHSAVATAAGVGAREVVVLVDRSYSMGYADRWSRALDAARSAVSGLTTMDRATVIAFDNEAAAVTLPTRERGTLDAAIGNLKPGSEGTRYGPALKLASQILAGSNLPRKEVVIVTDFQRRGWTSRDEVTFPTGTKITSVDLGVDSTLANVSVADVSVQRNEGAERDRATVAARVTSTGTSAVADVDVALDLNGRTAETRRVTIPARGATQVRFSPIAIPNGTSAGIVRLSGSSVSGKANQLAADDRFYFTVSPDASISVLVVEPPTAREHQSLYFDRALSIGDRPSFHVDVKKVGALVPADLVGRSLVVFNEVAPPTPTLSARLREFVTAGGGLLVVPGDQLPAGAWGGEWASALPATIGAVVDRTGEAGGTLAWVDYDHPVFDVFNAPRSGDFATARFLRYRKLAVRTDTAKGPRTAADSAAVAHILARFDDGSPALVERAMARGKVIVWGSTIDGFWNDLVLQPVFLPFAHQLAKHAGRYSDAKAWLTAGDVLDLSRHAELSLTQAPATKENSVVVVEAPSGAKTRLPGAAEGLIPLHEQGFYEIRPEGAARGTGRRVAVNLDPGEANLARIDPLELTTAALASSGARDVASVKDGSTREEDERRQTIWWYLLALAGVLLASETILSNRLSRTTT